MAILALLPLLCHAQWPYQTTIGLNTNAGSQQTSTLKLWLPSSGTKAIFFLSNRSPMCTRMSVDPELRALAEQHHFGILLSDGGPIIISFEGGAAGAGGTLGHADSIQAGLNRLAGQASNDSIKHWPLVSFGHSLGTYFSQGIGLYSVGNRGTATPEMIAGVVSYHLGATTLAQQTWSTSAQQQAFATLPHLWMNAELEGPEANNGSSLTYFAAEGRQNTLNRLQTGELVHQTVLQGGNHSVYDQKVLNLIALFVAKCATYRVPAGHDFSAGRPALLPIDRTQGWLGLTTAYTSFDSANVQIKPYAAADAASWWWLFDSTYATAWADYHRNAAGLSVQGNLDPTYCPGSTVSLTLNAKAWATPAPDNRYLAIISSAQANYESPGQGPRMVSLPANFSGGNLTLTLPDNYATPGTASPLTPAIVGGNGQYFIKLVGTKPFVTSNVLGPFNIANSASCPQAELFLTPIRSDVGPYYWNQLCAGRDTTLRVTVVKQGGALAAGNDITVELSDSVGSFANPTVLTTRSTTLPLISNTTWNRDTITVSIPASQLTPGYGYRLRAVSSNPALTSTSNGGDIIIYNCSNPLLSQDEQLASIKPTLQLFPNPAQEVVNLKLTGNVANAQVFVQNQLGQLVFTGPMDERAALSCSHWPSGIYFITVKTGATTLRQKLVR